MRSAVFGTPPPTGGKVKDINRTLTKNSPETEIASYQRILRLAELLLSLTPNTIY
jgi:hypothetical protein